MPSPRRAPRLALPFHRTGWRQPRAEGLALFYPAACYPYKNHGLLAEIRGRDARQWPVHRLVLTVPADRNPNPALEWIDCVGALEPRRMLDHYASADALVFLSKLESYGLPLVEAMHVGLPVICPDLPYARVLCGDEAIYFDARSVESLREAVCELRARLQRGWWPDWSDRLGRIPATWPEVASAFAMAAVSGNVDR